MSIRKAGSTLQVSRAALSQIIASRSRTLVQEWCAFIDAKSIAVLCPCDAAGGRFCLRPDPRATACFGRRLPSAIIALMPKAPSKNGLFGWRGREASRRIARAEPTRGSRDERGISGQVDQDVEGDSGR